MPRLVYVALILLSLFWGGSFYFNKILLLDPTKIVTRGGVTYAVINSLTNSTYSVVWNPVEFKDVEQHWSKDAVNDMGSRMIISGVGNGMFNPDQDITRAEFAAIIVRGLGLKLDTGVSIFSDVKASAWYKVR